MSYSRDAVAMSGAAPSSDDCRIRLSSEVSSQFAPTTSQISFPMRGSRAVAATRRAEPIQVSTGWPMTHMTIGLFSATSHTAKAIGEMRVWNHCGGWVSNSRGEVHPQRSKNEYDD